MRLVDTSPGAEATRFAALRKMGSSGRAAALVELCDDSRELARAGIRRRHPGYTADEVEHALHRLLLGDDLADRVWPDAAHLRP